ncbi:MAG: oxygenase MpaB family protein [Chryseolinea sp.]
MKYFVEKGSIVRQIWGKSDTILFMFAGAAAEFALNKAVDWLYFTGRLPEDPLGRLFSTVSYARAIIFSEDHAAVQAIDAMTAVHANVEAKRGKKIPDWAYRDVLFMLIDYSIRSFEVLERDLTNREKNEVFQVFKRVGTRMGISELPENIEQWSAMRQQHLRDNLKYSAFTKDLFIQYRKHLGPGRFKILLEVQTVVVPHMVHQLLSFKKTSFLSPLIALYKMMKQVNLDWFLKELILPPKYKRAINALDHPV